MTFIISASFVLTVAYFAITLICTLHDCLVIRHRRHNAVTDLDYAALSEELSIDIQASEKALGLAPVEVIELPNSIRGLRDFVRAEKLQAAIKRLTGKSVSRCSKDELLGAVRLAIA